MSSVFTPVLGRTGKIVLRHGPMFAAKTTAAVSVASAMAEHNKVMFINSSADVRQTDGGEEGKFSSHNPSNIKLDDRVTCVTVTDLSAADVSGVQVIVIDEAQFYHDLYDVVTRWAREEKKHVWVFGLDGDVNQKPIGHILDLIPVADDTKKMYAQCRICVDHLRKAGFEGCIDHCLAPFTTSIDRLDSKYCVGGKNLYIPVCAEHAAEVRRMRSREEMVLRNSI